MTMQNTNYDFIGDVHGHADALKELLHQLGYKCCDGALRHPTRQAVFVGDLIDRGPKIRETLHLVRAMVENGAALAVMGNHEFNALCYHAPAPDGGFLRPHSEKNTHQHQETLDQFQGHEREWHDFLDWFLTLPLWTELPGVRVIHACWSEPHRQMLGGKDRLTRSMLLPASSRGTREHLAIEALLKGIEFELPDGCRQADKGGVLRATARVKWWEPARGRTYREIAFPHSAELPDHPVPDHEADKLHPYLDKTSVFFGHYWLPSDLPKQPMASHLACLDFSVAKDGYLVAYRWDGEQQLSPEKFLAVSP